MLKELETNTEHQKQTRQVSAEFQEVSTNLRLHDQSAVQYLACDCFMLVQCCPSFVLLPDTCHSRQMNISLRRQPKFSKSVYLTNLMHCFFFWVEDSEELIKQKNYGVCSRLQTIYLEARRISNSFKTNSEDTRQYHIKRFSSSLLWKILLKFGTL